jgi:hypothetical protein
VAEVARDLMERPGDTVMLWKDEEQISIGSNLKGD